MSDGSNDGNRLDGRDVEWFQYMRDDCEKYNVAYFHKQNGGNVKIDGSYGGHLLDRKAYREFPEWDGEL
jgi:protein gp37